MARKDPTTVTRKPGRPEGVRTAERPLVTVRPAQCPSCRSSNRAPFRDGPLEELTVDVALLGQRYNRERWYNTECVDCGQKYRVIEYRFEPPQPPPPPCATGSASAAPGTIAGNGGEADGE